MTLEEEIQNFINAILVNAEPIPYTNHGFKLFRDLYEKAFRETYPNLKMQVLPLTDEDRRNRKCPTILLDLREEKFSLVPTIEADVKFYCPVCDIELLTPHKGCDIRGHCRSCDNVYLVDYVKAVYPDGEVIGLSEAGIEPAGDCNLCHRSGAKQI